MSLQQHLYNTALHLVDNGKCNDAVPLFWQAIQLGHVSSRAELACLLTEGLIDLKSNDDINNIAFSLVKDHEGNQDCMAMKAILMWGSKGCSFNKKDESSVSIIIKLTESSQDSKFGKYMKGRLFFEDTVGYVVSKYKNNLCMALECFIEASKMGCQAAYYRIALIYNFRSEYINFHKAIDNYKSAIKTGHLFSFENLSKIYTQQGKNDDAAKIFFSLLKSHDLKLRHYAQASLIELGYPYVNTSKKMVLTDGDKLIIDISNISAGGYDKLVGTFIDKLFEKNTKLTGAAFGSKSTAKHPCILSELLEASSRKYSGLTISLKDRLHTDAEDENVDLEIKTAISAYTEGGRLFVFSNDANNEHGEDSIYNAVKGRLEAGKKVVTVVATDISLVSKKYSNLKKNHSENYEVMTFIDFLTIFNEGKNFGDLKVTSPVTPDEEYKPTQEEENAIIAAKCLQKKDRTVFKVNQCVLAHLEGECKPAIVTGINSDLEYVYPYHIKLDESTKQFYMSVQQLSPARVKPAFEIGDEVLWRNIGGEWNTGELEAKFKDGYPYFIKTVGGVEVKDVAQCLKENEKIMSWRPKDERWFPAQVTKVFPLPQKTPYRIIFDDYVKKYKVSAALTRRKKVASIELVHDSSKTVSQKFKIQQKILVKCEPYWEHGEVIGFNPKLECPYEVKLDTEEKIFIFKEDELATPEDYAIKAAEEEEAAEARSVAKAATSKAPNASAAATSKATSKASNASAAASNAAAATSKASNASAAASNAAAATSKATSKASNASAAASNATPNAAAAPAAGKAAQHYAVAPPVPKFKLGDRVEGFWRRDKKWYLATFKRYKDTGMAIIEFDIEKGKEYSVDPKEVRPKINRGGSIEDIYKKKYLKYKNKYIQLKLHFQ
jgi:hypothetical protein